VESFNLVDTRSEISGDERDFYKEDLGDPKRKYLTRSVENRCSYEEEALHLPVEGDFYW